ncbi:methyl-accepting chemotaxis protein [Desulfitobacterium hafniense]|uniref:methyl-accepting chemotaxis protein n=1 Tax=Desulfitobacterium hafniense TaxID=49338 RepID=UPI000380FD91|nr:methyl-accepting chemotaxis protein [Desulfitobacterium hafniense]
MKAIANLKVSTKLVMSFCLLALITFAVGGLGVFNTLRLQEMDQELYTYQTLPLLELRVIHGSFEENRAYIRDIILEEDPAQIETHLKAIEQNRQIIDQALATFGQSLRTEEETLQFTYLDNVLENFDYHLDQVMELCRHGNKTFAYTVLAQDGPKLSANFSAAIDNLSLIKEQTGHEVAAANKARAESAFWQTIIFVLGAGVLAVVLGVTISRLISTPLSALAKAANEIASGNLVSQIPAKYRTAKDEIGQLGMVFQTMTENIRNLIHQVQESAGMVAASSEELNAGAGHAAEAGSQVAHAVSATADGAQVQVTALSETMATVENMAKVIEQIAANSTSATLIAEKAAQAAVQGSSKIDTVVVKMADIKQSVEHSALVVSELGTRSKEIDQIVSTISGLAAQTNLLALNAAIEAARAGEEGRGFSVVAEEVRKLAEQSQQAAKQIAVLIQSIQLDTQRAMTAMTEGTSEVQAGYAAVNEAGGVFADIAALVRTASDQIMEISAGVEGMSMDSHSMVNSVSKVEEISRQTSDQTQMVSAATQEQSSALTEIASSSGALAQLADQLQQAVSRFKIT